MLSIDQEFLNPKRKLFANALQDMQERAEILLEDIKEADDPDINLLNNEIAEISKCYDKFEILKRWYGDISLQESEKLIALRDIFDSIISALKNYNIFKSDAESFRNRIVRTLDGLKFKPMVGDSLSPSTEVSDTKDSKKDAEENSDSLSDSLKFNPNLRYSFFPPSEVPDTKDSDRIEKLTNRVSFFSSGDVMTESGQKKIDEIIIEIGKELNADISEANLLKIEPALKSLQEIVWRAKDLANLYLIKENVKFIEKVGYKKNQSEIDKNSLLASKAKELNAAIEDLLNKLNKKLKSEQDKIQDQSCIIA